MTSIRRVTVFGGSGFIGRYIVQRLARRGAIVAVVTCAEDITDRLIVEKQQEALRAAEQVRAAHAVVMASSARPWVV